MREELWLMMDMESGPFGSELEMVFKLLGPLVNHCLYLLTLVAYINPMGLWLVLLY